jgi:hypothetical protein
MLMLLLWGGHPTACAVNPPPPASESTSESTAGNPGAIAPEATSEQAPVPIPDGAIQVKYLRILPGAVQSVNLQPAVLRMIVTSNAGNITLRCGDSIQTYTCSPGRILTIERVPDQAMTNFRAQNDGNQAVRLRLDIYEQLP